MGLSVGKALVRWGLVMLAAPLSFVASAQYVDLEAERAAAQAAGGTANAPAGQSTGSASALDTPYGARPAQAYPAANYGASTAPAAANAVTASGGSTRPAAVAGSQAGGADLRNVFLQMQQLQQEVRRLNGKVEEQSFELSSLKEQSLQRYMDLDKRFKFVDPLIALTAIAVNTKTLLLGTGVNIVSQANPMYLAKQAASLDFVSGGRFMLGAGIGWLKEEFDAMGVPFERRGARFDDYIVAMKKVWSGEVVEHQSEFINWSGFKSYPVPHRKSGVPIVMGGTKGKIYERVARHGDGWFLPVDNPEALAAKMMPLAAACADEGRDPDTIEISCMWNMQGGIDAIKAFEDAGASRVILPIFGLGKDPVVGLTEFADTIISKF